MDDFEKGIAGFLVLNEVEAHLTLQYVVAGIAKGLAKSSPVDRGDYLSNWRADKNNDPSSEPVTITTNRRFNEDRLLEESGDALFGDRVIFKNADEVARILEFGTSEQAPAGIVRLISRSYPKLVKAAQAKASLKVKTLGDAKKVAGKNPEELVRRLL